MPARAHDEPGSPPATDSAVAGAGRPPALSVVVVVYNMRREAARTLRSLTPGYQRDIRAEDYEVLVVENGSSEPLDADFVAGCGANFRYLPAPAPTASPTGAVNFGLAQARGGLIAVMIDGARLASPGLLAHALSAARLHPRAVVATTSWHLGPASQQQSVADGYTPRREDALLDAIGWPHGDGYRLFEIAAPARSAREGIFRVPGESNFLCLPRALLLDELGGCDERFSLPGGGLVNQDLLRRACGLPASELVLLLGEATFHQLHGGISTNPDAATPAKLGQQWQAQYQEIRGEPFTKSTRAPRLYGHIPPALAGAAAWSARLSAALDATVNAARRTELIEAARQEDTAARLEQQRWLLLAESLPDGPGVAADAETILPSDGTRAVAASEAPAASWWRGWLPRPASAARSARKTLLFCVNYRALQGAHLKTRHYFEHARHSDSWEPRVYFDPKTVWDADNPWHDERANALAEYAPEAADALFIDGLHNWLRLPVARRGHWPVPVVCTIQGFRHANPHKEYKDFLGCRAVRVCVSEQVRAAIVGTGRVNGPTLVIPNAIDLPVSSGHDSSPRAGGFVIAGMKNPELAVELETRLRGSGWEVRAILGRVSRERFVAELRAADTALLLPRPKEGFYLPALEAMALGTRVICPDVLGNRSFCLNGINCRRPAYTTDALLAACAAMRAQSPADRERMLTHARETAIQHSLAHEREEFLRVLENLPALWQQQAGGMEINSRRI